MYENSEPFRYFILWFGFKVDSACHSARTVPGKLIPTVIHTIHQRSSPTEKVHLSSLPILLFGVKWDLILGTSMDFGRRFNLRIQVDICYSSVCHFGQGFLPCCEGMITVHSAPLFLQETMPGITLSRL